MIKSVIIVIAVSGEKSISIFAYSKSFSVFSPLHFRYLLPVFAKEAGGRLQNLPLRLVELLAGHPDVLLSEGCQFYRGFENVVFHSAEVLLVEEVALEQQFRQLLILKNVLDVDLLVPADLLRHEHILVGLYAFPYFLVLLE